MCIRDSYTIEKRYIHKNGSVVWVKVTVCPVTKKSGKVKSSLAVIEDITAIKQDRQQLRQQSTAIDAALDGMAILDNGKFIYLNPSHAHIFGYEYASELLGKSWEILYHPQDIENLKNQVFPLLSKQGYWRGEVRARKKDGSLFDEELALITIENNQLVCIGRDISDRKSQEKELQESRRRYQNLTLSLIHI